MLLAEVYILNKKYSDSVFINISFYANYIA